jgi:hypothetical protein
VRIHLVVHGSVSVTPDWQNPVEYQRLRKIDRAGLMWEWLRRDPGYIAWHCQASRATAGQAATTKTPGGTIADWGLHFR